MLLQFKCDLQQMCLLAAAQGVWQQNENRSKIKEILFHMDKMGNRKEWQKLTKEVIKSMSPLPLPANLNDELLFAIKDTGYRIYDWYFYLRNIHFIDDVFTEDIYETYLKDIYWTSIGTIDERKTLESFWFKNTDIDSFKLFLIASMFCCEDLVHVLWEKLPKDVQSADYSEFYNNGSSLILAYWISKKRSPSDDLTDNIKRLYESDSIYFNSNGTLEENFLKLALSKGCHLAVKYFWQKLSIEEKQEEIYNQFVGALCAYYSTVPLEEIRQYKKDRCLESCILFFNKMSEDMKRHLIEADNKGEKILNYAFLKMLTSAYPWQEFLAPAFRQIQGHYNLQDFKSFFQELTYVMLDNIYDFDLPEKNSILQRQIPMLWETVPSAFKFPMAEILLFPLFRSWNIKTTQFILNDKDISQGRKELLRQSYGLLMDLIVDNRWKKMKQFVEEFLILKNWDNDVKERVKKIYHIIMFDLQVEPAKTFLDSEYSSDEDKKKLLEELNHEIVGYYLAKRDRLDVLDEYSKWIFPAEDDFIIFKKSFQSIKCSFPFIYDILTEITEQWSFGEPIVTKFLKWIFYSEDNVLAFKKNDLWEDLKKNNWANLRFIFFRHDILDRLPHFLSWCSFSALEVDQIKRGILALHVNKKCEKYIKKNKLIRAKKLITFALDSENERNKFKSEFIASEKGLKSLRFFIGTAKTWEVVPELKKKELEEKFKAFIDFWVIKSLKHILIIERDLSEFYESKLKKLCKTNNDKKTVVNLNFEEHETVIFNLNHDYESDPNLNLLIWDEENFILFLSLLAEARIECIKSIKNVKTTLKE